MTQHTPGPWAINADYPRTIIAGETIVASVTVGPDRNPMLQHHKPPTDEAAANARRIVACVNACAGINPKAVKGLAALIKAGIDIYEFPSDSEFETLDRLGTWADEATALLAKAKEIEP